MVDWFKYPELENYAEIIADSMEDSMNINFDDEKTEEIYFLVGKKYGYEYQEELIYRAKAIAQDKGKLRTTDNECPVSYKCKKQKPLI